MTTVIRAEQLAKCYTIRHENTSAAASGGQEKFWALTNVSFTVEQGDRVGVIGRNGAGKSTLLKILSRITKPSSGSLRVWGRIASLLEVGTGFHPELSGRENVFLNGALLGMSKREIRAKFDEIVAFSEVERFLDTPVKRYSSGMYVRLAFAVAAHLEPEILIVDEVLSVGDAAFQAKCLSKMQDVARSGRTVLYVSHNMVSVNNLCTSSILLDQGEVAFHGSTRDAIDKYMSAGVVAQPGDDLSALRASWATPLISAVRILDVHGNEQSHFALGATLTVEMTFNSPQGAELSEPVMGVVLNHPVFGVVGGVNTRMTDFRMRPGPFRSAVMRCTLNCLPLLQGQYNVDVWLGDGPNDLDTIAKCLTFVIEETDVYDTGHAPFGYLGVVYFNPTWTVDSIQRASLPFEEQENVGTSSPGLL